jgi:hypothetical protein
MIMFGSFLPSLLVGFSTTNFTRAGEPTLSWNQLRSLALVARVRPGASHACILGANSGDRYLSVLKMSASAFQLPPCCFFQTTTYFPGMVIGAPCASFSLSSNVPTS